MKKSLVISIIGILINLTAFSQLQIDKKIDSFYCFGPTKAKQLVETKFNEEAYREMYNSCTEETYNLRKVKSATDSIIISLNNKYENQLQTTSEKDTQNAILEKKYSIGKKQLRKSKATNIGIGLAAGISLVGNLILVTKIIINK